MFISFCVEFQYKYLKYHRKYYLELAAIFVFCIYPTLREIGEAGSSAGAPQRSLKTENYRAINME